MIRNYFKIALRNIKRYTAHSILNIGGMAIGMACAILILLWVQDEWSYDRHFKNADNLFRVIENPNLSDGEASPMAAPQNPIAPALKDEYPEIIRYTRLIHTPFQLKKGDENIEEIVNVVDKDFFKMFNIVFIQGDINTAFNNPQSIVLSEKMAKKYFGDKNALGKTLPSGNIILTVTGIVKSLPRNTHIQFDFLLPTELFMKFDPNFNVWGAARSYTYVELKDGTDSKVVDSKIRNTIKKHLNGSKAEIFLQNIKEIHLFSSRKYIYDLSGHGDITYVRIMGIIAIFILLIACINFMNLATAQSARRAKEIGIRKVAGANKQKIIFQFLGEAMLIVFVAHIIAMILVELLLPGLNNFTGKQLTVDYRSAGLYIGLIGVVLFCGLLAGSYPALYLSSLKPLDTIKGVINKTPGNAQFRRILVIIQFSLSVLLIICTLIVARQLNYMQNMNLGFNKNNIGYFMFPARDNDPKIETLKKELLNNPDILSISLTRFNPSNTEGAMGGINWSEKTVGEDVLFYYQSVDENYANTFQLELKQGRFFSTEFSTDKSAVVINEKAAEIMGFKEPLGESITTPWGAKFTIIGIVKNFHFQSLHYKIEPLIMQLGGSNNIYVKMKPERVVSTVEFIRSKYKSFHEAKPFDFRFLDDDYNDLYMSEQRMGKIFGYFAFLAILISCLGLIGLSSFMTERRTKEIGIRKVNGANIVEIFLLLSREYLIWVSMSIIIACPIAWYVMNRWLQDYAYRINISWWIFAFTSIVALLIALLTVSAQSYKAALKNPVDALRYE
jgi:ABC-type antimicrobial peptide transport system permease subunit